MKQVRIILWALVGIALIAFAVLFFLSRSAAEQQQPVQMVNAESFGGDFTAVGSDGQPFSSDELSGKPYAIFFGFTHCPDVCPTTLARLTNLRQQLGEGEDAFKIVFVTTDPERDGPQEVGAYSEAFAGPVIGLTGSPEQIEHVKKQYGVFSQKVPDGSGGYTVDHTATTLLFDSEGGFVGTISPEEQDQAALDKLKRIAA